MRHAVVHLACLSFLAGAACAAGAASVPPRAAAGPSPLQDSTVASVFESASPSMVSIEMAPLPSPPRAAAQDDEEHEESLLARSRRESHSGKFAGFVWDARGLVLTTSQAGDRDAAFSVGLADGRRYRAELIGADPVHGIAVLRIVEPPAGLRPLPVADGAMPRVGQRLSLIGNPWQLGPALAVGHVATGVRDLVGSEARRVFLADLPVRTGDGGAPVLDDGGQLVGMAEGWVGSTGSSMGVVIWAGDFARQVPRLVRDGRIDHPRLGIGGGFGVSKETAGLPPGFVVRDVRPGSEAARAGLVAAKGEATDVITAIDGHPIASRPDVRDALERFHAGDRCRITVWRGGQLREVDIVLGDAKD